MIAVKPEVPPYAIAQNNSAKVVKFRFENEIIDKLTSINLFERIDNYFIERFLDDFYS